MNTYYSSKKSNELCCCRFVLDADNWIIINADTSFQHIFQYSYMEINENNAFSAYVYNEDYRPLVQSLRNQLSSGSRITAANYRIVTKRGEIYSASFSGCVSYEDGVALMECILFNFRLLRDGESEESDISGNEIFRKTISLFENMPVGFLMMSVLLNKDKKPYDIIPDYINTSACKLLNTESRLIIGKKCFCDMGETDERALEYFYEAAYNGKSFDIVSMNKTVGTYQHYYFYRVYDGCAGLVIADANDEVLIRRKYGVLENYINTVPDNLKTGIVQYLDDEYKTIVYANNAAYNMFGYERDEFKNKFNNRLDAILESNSETQKAKEKIKALKLYEPSYSFEREIYTKTGGKRRFIENTMRIINRDGLEILQSEFIDTEDITNNKNESELINRISPYMMVKYHIKDKLYILSANDKFYDFFGIDKDFYDGNPMLRTHEEDMNIVSRALADASEGKDVDFIYRAVINKHSVYTLHVVGGCIGYKLGYPIYIMMFSDISPLKAVHEEAMCEKARFDVFLKASRDIVFEYIINSDTLKLYVNISDDSGSRAECIVYEKFSKTADNGKLIHSEDAGKMLDIIFGRAGGKALIRAKNIQNPSDDKMCVYDVSGNMIRQRGASDRFAGIMRRISRSSAVLPAEENIIKAVSVKFLEKCDHAICLDMTSGAYRHIRMKNSALRVTDFGDYDIDILAYAKKNISRENTADFIETMSRAGIRHILEFEKSHFFIFRTKNGDSIGYKTAEYSYADDKHDMVIICIEDISEIYLSKNAIFNIDKDVSFNFLMRISKDITTPLNMIVSLISSAKNAADEPEQLAVYLNKINACTASVSEFINNIIDLVKLESGRFTVENEIFSVKDLLSGINNIAAPRANGKGINFEITADGQLRDYYLGDAVKINHIIMLLLINSLKYTPAKGFIGITLSAGEITGRVHTLIIEIKNSGAGIPENVIDNLFNLYEFSNDSHINTEITLTIVKLMAEAMDGSVKISSGGGSTAVYVSIPVTVCAGETDTANIKPIGHRNILIAKENIIHAESAVSSAVSKNGSFDIAVTGDNAVALYLDSIDGYYDYIFVDMSIDNNRGEDVIARIRLSSRSDSNVVKIIAVVRDEENITKISDADEVLTRTQEINKINEIFGA